MTHRFFLLLLAASHCVSVTAQKTAYIPNYLLNPTTVDGSQFTWSKTHQSANFTLIWGNTVGDNPANYPDPDLAFDPVALLDTMEYIYAAFKGFGFPDDTPGTNLSQYKIPIVMYGTWGPNGAQGFANGGDADGVVGAFWVHPIAMKDGGVAAHELTHSLQAQCNIDYRAAQGLGLVWLNAGIFWETHANFMRNLLYPKAVSAWGMDVYHTETWGDWKNTYENYQLLLAIMESEGIDMVNRLWRESLSDEYPLQAYKRLAGYNQAQFNDSLFHYARRMATFNFNYNNIGSWFRQYRNADLSSHLPSVQATYSILRKIPGAAHRYEIPIEQAPEEFAYNVIPLYPEADTCAVVIKFKGHTEANPHAGWRYAFVAADPDGTLRRYSPTYSENTGEINFRLQGSETKLFLVVMGAPFDQITTNTTNDTWQGYPKHFRHPYELTISGAKPEGFQPPATFRAQLKFNGHLHPNGGGWVQNSASVANSVYVGPAAMVLGNANISGDVRIENTALVRNAVVSGQVRIRDNAFVDRGNYSGSAVVQGQGFAENVTMSDNALIGMRAKVTNYNLSGTAEVGGDVVVYNENGACDNGVYYRLTNYYDNKLLECDNRTANHPANKDVNNTYSLFSNEVMATQCQCAYEGAPPPLLLQFDAPPILCAGMTGQTTAAATGGAPPYSYQWSTGTTGDTLLSMAGSFTVSVTDGQACAQVQTIEIPEASAVTNQATIQHATSAVATDGAVLVTDVSGGVAPYVFNWNTGAGTPSLENIPPGTYTLSITDAAGCTWISSYTVSFQSPAPHRNQLDVQAQIVPNPGTSAAVLWLELPQDQHLDIRISDTFGRVLYTTATWFPSGKGRMVLPTGLAAGTYRVQVSDKLGRQMALLWMVL
jgi:hypothetical protein